MYNQFERVRRSLRVVEVLKHLLQFCKVDAEADISLEGTLQSADFAQYCDSTGCPEAKVKSTVTGTTIVNRRNGYVGRK